MSMTAAGWPSAAARFTSRPSAMTYSSLAAEVVLLDVLADLADVALGHLAQRLEVQLVVEVAAVGHDRAFLHRLEVLARKTLRLPVAVTNRSPHAAASIAGMTWKPSMSASMAAIGSTSTIATWAPMPRMRDAMPLPTQP